MKKRILFFIFLCLYNCLIAQEPTSDFTPISPNAASFARYGETQISPFTGVPQLNIPLYTIKSSELELPLFLSYHAGGNRVSDVASWVGLGWSLGAIPTISRKIIGTPDESTVTDGIMGLSNYSQAYFPNTTLSDLFFTEMNKSQFAYSHYENTVSMGMTDTSPDIFYYNLPGVSGKFYYNESLGDFVKFEKNNVKIDWSIVGYQIVFTITDTNGAIYDFDVYEYSFFGSQGSPDNKVSTWKPSKITSSSKKDIINLEYEGEATTTSSPLRYAHYFKISNALNFSNWDGNGSQPILPVNTYPNVLPSNTLIPTQNKILQKIVFKNGYIDFKTKKEREDVYSVPLNTANRLDELVVYDKNDTIVKRFKFNNSYIEPQSPIDSFDKRMVLDSLIEYAGSGQKKGQTYLFEYKRTEVPTYRSLGCDFWGFYNGKNNASLLPSTTLPIPDFYGETFYNGADRTVDTEKSKFGILTKITYPTKGFTEYEYESNTTAVTDLHEQITADTNGNFKVGGLRIKEIRNYSKHGAIPIVKRYKYTKTYEGLLSSGDVSSKMESFFDKFWYYGDYCNFTSCGGAQDNIWFYYSLYTQSIQPEIHIGSLGIGYSNVFETTDAPNNSGYVQYKFSNPRDLSPGSGAFAYESKEYLRGELLETINYKKTSIGFEKISKKINTYEGWAYGHVQNGYEWKTHHMSTEEIGYENELELQPGSEHENLNCFKPTKFYESSRVLDKSITINYFNNDSIVNEQKYYYDNYQHNLPTRTKITNSSGDTIKTITKYPQDIANPGPVIVNLINQNRISIPLSYISYIDKNNNDIIDIGSDEKITEQEMLFKNWHSDINALELIKISKGTEVLEDNIVYYNYDTYGNPMEISKTDGPHTVYLWGYNYTQPIAKIENATYAQAMGALSKASNDNLSYLQNYNDSQLRTEFNKLRNGLSNAMVTTYLYKPLVGVKEITNPKGYKMTYEYDDFNRLKAVKDSEGKLVEDYEYNYKN